MKGQGPAAGALWECRHKGHIPPGGLSPSPSLLHSLQFLISPLSSLSSFDCALVDLGEPAQNSAQYPEIWWVLPLPPRPGRQGQRELLRQWGPLGTERAGNAAKGRALPGQRQ